MCDTTKMAKNLSEWLNFTKAPGDNTIDFSDKKYNNKKEILILYYGKHKRERVNYGKEKH